LCFPVKDKSEKQQKIPLLRATCYLSPPPHTSLAKATLRHSSCVGSALQHV